MENMASCGDSCAQGADRVSSVGLVEVLRDVMMDLGAVDEQSFLCNPAYATAVMDCTVMEFQPLDDVCQLLDLGNQPGSGGVQLDSSLAPGRPFRETPGVTVVQGAACSFVEDASMEVGDVGSGSPGVSSCDVSNITASPREEPGCILAVLNARPSQQPSCGKDEVGGSVGGVLHPGAVASLKNIFNILANMFETRSVLVETQRFCRINI